MIRIALKLAEKELHSKMTGTAFGIFWLFAPPVITILVFWLVFSYGLRSRGPNNLPFIVYYAGPYIAWHFFQETINSGTTCIGKYAFLLKKIKFDSLVIPVVELLVATFTHLILMVMVIVIYSANGYFPSIKLFNLLYVYCGLSVLSLGLMYFFSTLNVYIKDTAHIVSMSLNIIFWATPIVWDSGVLDNSYFKFLKYSPINFIIDGYRYSFSGISYGYLSFSNHLYFWILAITILIVGKRMFNFSKSAFVDLV